MECTITVTATVGSPFAPKDGTDGSALVGTGSTGVTGYPVGHGPVEDTADDHGQPVTALLLMPEPALPGGTLTARPVAVLHVSAPGRAQAVVVCVPTHDAHFATLTDLDRLRAWQVDEQSAALVLRRLDRGHSLMWSVTRIEGTEPAAAYLVAARARYRQVTGAPAPEFQ